MTILILFIEIDQCPWSRNTKWRQGSLLSNPQGLSALGLSQNHAQVAMAISHSCDIAQDDIIKEPVIEFVSCNRIEKEDGQCTFGKNPRILHLPILYNNNASTLQITPTKYFITKEKLFPYAPDDNYVLDISGENILQSWLSSRYKRHALPNSLVSRIDPIFDFLIKQGKRYTSDIVGYWMKFDPNSELNEEEPYEVELQIVYSIDNPSFEEIVTQMARQLVDKFSGKLKGVELRTCKATSETEFTLWDLRNNIEFKLDYLSSREELRRGKEARLENT